MKHIPPIMCLFLVLLTTSLSGQELQADINESQIKILGTSSLHDWESQVEDFDFRANANDNGISDIEGTVSVKSIKSGKSIMDDKTFKALDAENYEEIKITSKRLSFNGDKIEGEVAVQIKGQKISYPVNSTATKNQGVITVAGEVMIDMTDFGIEPPTAMFGTLTTGQQVTIVYNIKMKIK